MYKISDFAALSRVSAKMLRHYAAIGLLTPAYTDRLTGYRYYTPDQLTRLNRIVALKDLGFPLEQIGTLLDSGLSADQLHDALLQRREQVAQRIVEEQRRLAEIDRRLGQLGARRPTYEVLLRPVTPLPAVASRVIVADEREVSDVLHAVEQYVARARARAAQPAMVVYHACAPGAVEVEVAVPVTTLVTGASWAQPATLPGAPLMACVVHTGDDAGLPDACDALHEWVAVHGYRPAGPYRERYLRYHAGRASPLPPALSAPHPQAAVTELQLPVVPVTAA
ncbi:MAG TPA: MerR family transcriptional regulator [Chloroflexaceae bacterium]|nr:MerR family transcriptional regulator [Chloroflexaceae bacterium]